MKLVKIEITKVAKTLYPGLDKEIYIGAFYKNIASVWADSELVDEEYPYNLRLQDGEFEILEEIELTGMFDKKVEQIPTKDVKVVEQPQEIVTDEHRHDLLYIIDRLIDARQKSD